MAEQVHQRDGENFDLHAIERTRAEKEGYVLHLLWMCVIGLVAGALAKLIMPGKDPGGVIVTMLLGIARLPGRGVSWTSFGW